LKSQEKGELLAIRKQLHAETIFGETNLRQVKEIKLADALKKPNSIVDKEVKNEIIRLKSLGKDDEAIIKYFNDNKDIWSETENGKVKVYYFTKETNDRYFATRKSISDIVKKKEDIASITDTGIQKILQKHLEANEGDIEKAFSREGFEEMNQNIYKLNDNKPHKPIYKARKFEKSDKNFAVGNSGDKSKKFVKTAQGTNLFFAIYELNDKRSYVTIPLNLIIDCQKKYKGNWKEQLDSVLKEEKYVKNNKAKLLFIISPNDLVYIPTQEELKTKQYSFDRSRIYKLVSCDSTTAMFIPATFANVIFSMSTVDQKKNNVNYIIQNEIGKSMNKSKSEKSIIYGQEEQEEVIKETCIPIKVDRLGNIISCLYD
jgi:CRISPR-associated endonuclease Csn1